MIFPRASPIGICRHKIMNSPQNRDRGLMILEIVEIPRRIENYFQRQVLRPRLCLCWSVIIGMRMRRRMKKIKIMMIVMKKMRMGSSCCYCTMIMIITIMIMITITYTIMIIILMNLNRQCPSGRGGGKPTYLFF